MSEREPPLRAIGRELLGPAFWVQLRRTVEVADAHGLTALHFLSRDGWLFWELYHQMLGLHRKRRPRATYLEVSRLSTSLARVKRLGRRELEMVRGERRRGLRSVLAAFNLDEDREVLARAERFGFDAQSGALDRPWDPPALQALLDDGAFVALVRQRAEAARARLKGYLRAQGFFDGGRCALVDIGWSGTIQDNLEHVIAGEPGAPEVRGVYLGYVAGDHDRKEGTVYDLRRSSSLRDTVPLHFPHLFEQAGSARTGTVVDYRELDGEMAPRFHETGPAREAERAAWPAVEILQSGIRESVAQLLADEHAGRGEPLELTRDRAQRQLERFVFFPTEREVEVIGALIHVDDWGVRSFGNMVSSRPSGVRPDLYVDRFYESYWKPGFLYRAGGPWLCRLFHRYETAKLWWRSQGA